MSRDDFTNIVKTVIAQRAGYMCSRPECRRLTIGPHDDPSKSLSIGVAAHICAASPGGPRFDPDQSPEDRKCPENGIWLCHNCSDIIDKNPSDYPPDLLRQWKTEHENLLKHDGGPPEIPTICMSTLSGLELPPQGPVTITGEDVSKYREHSLVIENNNARPLMHFKGRIQFPERVVGFRIVKQAPGEQWQIAPDVMAFNVNATGGGSVSVIGGPRLACNYSFEVKELPPQSITEIHFLSVFESNWQHHANDDDAMKYFNYIESEFQFPLGKYYAVKKLFCVIDFNPEMRSMVSRPCQVEDGVHRLIRVHVW